MINIGFKFVVSFAIVLSFNVMLFSQTKKPPYIEFYDCPGCEHSLKKASDAVYPSMVGYGPHKYNGLFSVQVLVSEDGTVQKATAVSGHPFFRETVENAAKNVTFKPQLVNGKAATVTAIVQYQVVSTEKAEILPKPPPIINGMAISLPKPIYPDTAKSACANGFVDVQVNVDEFGNVEDAKAIRGDEQLWKAAVTAAMQARFTGHGHAPRAKSVGRVRYNFPIPDGCPVR